MRAEYPELVSVSKSDFVQIIPYDIEREEAQVNRKRQGLEHNLMSQIGLRWIIQAMCSNVEAGLRTNHTVPSTAYVKFQAETETTSVPANRADASQDESAEEKKPILVGHNLFLDLIYIYKCFFGPLPDQLEVFRSIMSALFPLIIDTKYLADIINQNSPRYKSSLEQIDEEFSRIPSPVIGRLQSQY